MIGETRQICFLIFFFALVRYASAIPSDSLVSRDTTKNNSTSFKSADTEIEITFDDKILAPKDVRIIFNQLFRQYTSIKDALAYNDPYGAVSNTLKLLDEMKTKSQKIELLNKDDRWVFFVKNFDGIKKKVESATFISEQRFLFNEITAGIRTFIKQYGLSDKTIYVYQCSTASELGTATWLSDKRDNKNPYLGLTKDTACAKVKEVWKFN